MPRGILPPETTLDEVKVRIQESYTNPNVGRIHQVVLKDGPRAFRIATLLEIINPKTSEFHHYSLKIDSIDRRKGEWFAKPEKSVRLEGDSPDEIERLYRFLKSLMEGQLSDRSGELHIIGSDDYAKLEQILEALPNLASSDKLALVRTVLSEISGVVSDVEGFVTAFQGTHTETLRHISTAARIVQYRGAFNELSELIKDETVLEQQFQECLKANPWMFGSEYSELLDRRKWTRDDSLDFMLRRTADGFLEIVEIKTPFKESLLVYDRSHDSYHPSAKLSSALGQVMRYIEEVERNRDSIVSQDHCDPLKIRARVIIGRDGNDQHQAALRNLNAHLHGIEVITFDQLCRIAERVLSVFDDDSDDQVGSEDNDDVPF